MNGEQGVHVLLGRGPEPAPAERGRGDREPRALHHRITPARKARLDALALKGFDPIAAILDFLDDEIFSTPAASPANVGSATGTLPISLGGHDSD